MKNYFSFSLTKSCAFFLNLSLIAIFGIAQEPQVFQANGLFVGVYDGDFSSCVVVNPPDSCQQYQGDYFIPDSVVINNKKVWVSGIKNMSNSNIRNVTLGDNIWTVHIGAFQGSQIQSFTGSTHMMSIGKEAFRGCTHLSQVTLPEMTLNIGVPVDLAGTFEEHYEYYDCRVFADCESLSDIYILKIDNLIQLNGHDFFTCSGDDPDLIFKQCTLHVPQNLLDYYKNSSQEWGKFNKIEALASVPEINSDSPHNTEYYNLQGVKVKNPVMGNLYIVRTGDKVSKQTFK